MIGRADIEGSKSNVAMNAWLPQASYPKGIPEGYGLKRGIIDMPVTAEIRLACISSINIIKLDSKGFVRECAI